MIWFSRSFFMSIFPLPQAESERVPCKSRKPWDRLATGFWRIEPFQHGAFLNDLFSKQGSIDRHDERERPQKCMLRCSCGTAKCDFAGGKDLQTKVSLLTDWIIVEKRPDSQPYQYLTVFCAGICVGGTCKCLIGWAGTDCSQVSALFQHSRNEFIGGYLVSHSL